MAEREGFEPPVPFGHTRFPVVHLQPLGHRSMVIARRPGTPQPRYRCFLPDLAGLTKLQSPGPSYRNKDAQSVLENMGYQTTARQKSCFWRSERDSNPRYLAVHVISSHAPSTSSAIAPQEDGFCTPTHGALTRWGRQDCKASGAAGKKTAATTGRSLRHTTRPKAQPCG